MKKNTFYLALGILATTGTTLFGLTAAHTVQAQQAKAPAEGGIKPVPRKTMTIMRCSTPAPTDEEKMDEEKAVQAFMSRAPGIGKRGGIGERGPGTVVIPVWFHIIRSTSGFGDISNERIYAQLKVLNIAYSGKERLASQLPGIQPSQTPTQNTVCRFVLAGIDRTNSDAYYGAAIGTSNYTAMKNALRKGENSDGKTGPKTLNIYFKPLDAYGIATFPYSYTSAPLQDGIVCLDTTIPGGTEVPYDLGKTAVHEAGHWLGLYHTFEGRCGSTNDNGTTVQGDGVDDTAAENTSYYGAVPSPYPDTCPSLPGRDPIENYMDYSDDNIYYQFTAGQDARIDTRIATFRGL